MIDYDNEEMEIKDLIESNLRQRGIGNPNPVKLGRCIKELERIYGFREGRPEKLSNNFTVNNQPTNESELAEQLGMTRQTLQNYKKLTEMIPELEELALISNNFGRRKNDPTKDRKALATYVELKGYKQGRPEKKSNMDSLTLDEIAKELNMSKSNLKRALRIERYLTDSMKELLDKGVIIK